ncbi:MAG: hypothetical protein SFY56_12875 [Bacteroidota bacterium]|nr:hypothetical protein [Bacteroidota bacterium]
MRFNLKNIVFVVVYVLTAVALIFYFTEIPISLKTPKNNYAAIAIRDNVSNLEKNGSLVFTQAYLNKKYKHNIYFTQSFREDKKQQFIDSLKMFLSKFEKVDVYLLAHHNYYYNWFQGIDAEALSHLNLVYNTGCGNAADSLIYKNLGAKYYIAHSGKKSISPIFYFYFLRRLDVTNHPKQATAQANRQLLKVLKFLRISNEIEEHEGTIY